MAQIAADDVDAGWVPTAPVSATYRALVDVQLAAGTRVPCTGAVAVVKAGGRVAMTGAIMKTRRMIVTTCSGY